MSPAADGRPVKSGSVVDVLFDLTFLKRGGRSVAALAYLLGVAAIAVYWLAQLWVTLSVSFGGFGSFLLLLANTVGCAFALLALRLALEVAVAIVEREPTA